jgi:hypothetical protein
MAGSRVKCDVRALVAEINQCGERAVKHISDEMRKYGELMLNEGIVNAPYDTGSLQEAIDIKYERKGINTRLVVTIFVDLAKPYKPKNGRATDKVVGDYAMLMERGLAPHGSGRFQAGKGTIGKGPQAGGRYFARAIQRYKKELIERARLVAKRAAKRRKKG